MVFFQSDFLLGGKVPSILIIVDVAIDKHMVKHISSHHLSTQFWDAQLQPDMVTNQHRVKLWREISSSFQLPEMYISCHYSDYSSQFTTCTCTTPIITVNLHLKNKDKIKKPAIPEDLSCLPSTNRVNLFILLLHGGSEKDMKRQPQIYKRGS